jgi:flagellar basal-body rod modification protein FlgD
MAVSSITSGASATDKIASQQAFRQADFLQIMLTEITNQDPLAPTETSKLVDNMKSLQELANTSYTKFRSDVTWAQNLVGKKVNVIQLAASEAERVKLVNKGLKPDVGFANLDGKIESFRVVEEEVWVSIGGKDYPIDNVKQVRSTANDPAQLAQVSSQLLGMRIQYYKDSVTDVTEGVVSSVGYDSDGNIRLGVGKNYAAYDHILAITVPSPTTTSTTTP